jgi:hypothetical protein
MVHGRAYRPLSRAAALALIALLAGIFAATDVRAQTVSIQAYVKETTVAVNEQVTYAIEISGASFADVRTPDPPQAKRLNLVQRRPRRSRQMSYQNGNVNRSITFRWTYRPERTGDARIGRARIRVDGRSYRTDPIPIRVTARRSSSASNRSRRSNAPDEDALFIRAEPSTRSVFRGEQATLTYRLYYHPDYRVRRSRMAGSWDAEGFWREELEVNSRPVPRMTTFQGERYKSIVLKRAAVFPTRAGSLQVDPLRIETEVHVPKRSRNLFDRFFSLDGEYEEKEIASPPVPIRVRPLPGSAPASFHGAVGSFRMQASVDQRAVEAGEPVEVTVRVNGAGNLSTLPPLPVDWPDAFDTYDPDVSTKLERTGDRLQGRKTFRYVLVPDEAGTFELPAVRFTYFDPAEERYETLQKELPDVRVKGVPASAEADSARTALPAHDIAGLMAEPSAQVQASSKPLYRNPWAYAALGLPLLALLGVLGYRRRRERLASNPAHARRREARPAARQRLKEARRLVDDSDQRRFFAALQRALLGYVGRRLNLPKRGLTRDQLDDHLSDAGVPGRQREKVRRLLAQTDQSRFAPADADRTAREAALKRTRSLIDELDDALS